MLQQRWLWLSQDLQKANCFVAGSVSAGQYMTPFVLHCAINMEHGVHAAVAAMTLF